MQQLKRERTEMNPLKAFADWQGSERVFWRPPKGQAIAGLGVNTAIEVDGTERFEAAADAAADFLAPGQFAFAGFAFASNTDHKDQTLWEGYPSGWLMIPEHIVQAPTANLGATEPPPNGSKNYMTRNTTAESTCKTAKLHIQDASRNSFRDAVAQATGDIKANKLTKVVVARTLDVLGAIDPADVIARLCRRFDSCAVFGFGRGRSCFLGASPELLLELKDDMVTTHALAGTAPRGLTPAQDQANMRCLASNPKDQAEHHHVVEYLQTRLALAGVALDPVGPTQVRTLPGIHHLSTKVTGRITPQPGIALRLVGALHPTPAVGGTPTAAAQQWIEQNEKLNRGWYSGPVGWIDHQGCGAFYIALRSALVSPTELQLFAGAGIVAGSDPQQELQETDLKLAAILDVIT